MRLTLIKRDFYFSEYGNYYFKDKDGDTYYWYTKSEKLYEEVEIGDEIEVTSYKIGDTWELDGEEIITLKNVRFKVLKIRIK
jgi:hypothetical protein